MLDGCKGDWRKDPADKGMVSVKPGSKWLRGGWGQAATEPLAFSEPKGRGASVLLPSPCRRLTHPCHNVLHLNPIVNGCI